MELHYSVNPTMEAMEASFFLPSVPSSMVLRRHFSEICTSGNFAEDNYGDIMIERTAKIVRLLRANLDGEVMIWSDVDIVFFEDFPDKLLGLMEGKDLLFQAEHGGESQTACFGFQVIRRSLDSLISYARVLMLQKASDDPHDQAWGNEVLKMDDSPRWGLLPLQFASESNGGLSEGAFLYHANCTIGDSQKKKWEKLSESISRRQSHADGFQR